MVYADDGQVGQWAKIKLAYLSSYLPQYTKATSKALNRYYIDGFAGTGTWLIRNTLESIKGSAQLALETEPSFTKYFFVEKDSDRAKELESLKRKYPRRNIEIICGDSNEKIEYILTQIHPRAPIFVFLDPSACHLKWTTLELLSKWKTELFINFPLQMDLQRNLPNDPNKLKPWRIAKLTQVFGGKQWRNIYERKFSLDGPRYSTFSLMELYITGLKELGYNYVMFSDAIKNDQGVKIYYMIWVGKNEVGKKIMEYVLKKQFNKQLTLFNE